ILRLQCSPPGSTRPFCRPLPVHYAYHGMEMRAYILLAVTLGFALSGCAPSATGSGPAPASPPVRNIIFFVADGGGAGLWTAARYGQEELSVERMPVVGLLDTRSASHKVTDSAAGATAYSTGERVSNRTIAVS